MRPALSIVLCLPLLACQSLRGVEEVDGADGDQPAGEGGVDGGAGLDANAGSAGSGAGSGAGSSSAGAGASSAGSHAGGSGAGDGGPEDDVLDAGADAAEATCSGADCAEDCNGVAGGDAVLDACGVCDDDSEDDCPVVATSGLVAEWRFDQSSGATVETTGRSRCGSACTATLLDFADTSGRDVDASSGWVAEPGVVGGAALRLDGMNDYLEIPDSDQLLHGWSAFTVELLVRVDDLSAAGGLFSCQDPSGASGHAFGSYIETDGTVAGGAYKSTVGCDADIGPCREVQSMTPIATGAFLHIAFELSAGQLAVFIDAVDQTDEWSAMGTLTTIANPNVASRIGAYFASGSPDLLFDGEIAVVRVYDRALTMTELADNRAAELP